MAWVVLYNETLGGYEQWLYLKDEMVSYIGASTSGIKDPRLEARY